MTNPIQDKWRNSPRDAFVDLLNQAEYSKSTKLVYLDVFGKFYRFQTNRGIALHNTIAADFGEFFATAKIDANGRTAPLAHNARLLYHAVFNQVFDEMAEAGMIDENPSKAVQNAERGRRRGRQPQRLPYVLNATEEERLFSVLAEGGSGFRRTRERAILLLLLTAGLRTTECAEARLSWLELGDDPKLRVAGKGAKERVIKLPLPVSDLLEAYLEVRRTAGVPGDYLFAGRRGTPPNKSTIFRMTNRALTAAGVDLTGKLHAGGHLLRHTFITRQFAAGHPLALVRYWAGHTELRTTQRYEHVTGSEGNVRPALPATRRAS